MIPKKQLYNKLATERRRSSESLHIIEKLSELRSLITTDTTVLANCVECDAPIFKKDEMLPDYEGLYQCPKCGHPNGDVVAMFGNAEKYGSYSSIKGYIKPKGESK